MAFTRTPTGLANYKLFFSAQLLVYTEGKIQKGSNDPVTADEAFYRAVFRYLVPAASVKIKCVGSRSEALDYAWKIEVNSIANEVVIVDRDLSQITHSVIPLKCLLHTNGYSWENDLWTVATMERILQGVAHRVPASLHDKVRHMVRRLRVLFVLDSAMQVHQAFLINKKASHGGIGFSFASRHVIPIRELRRLLTRYRNSAAVNCRISLQTRQAAWQAPASRVVQGHVWSNATRALIGYLYKQETRDTVAPSHQLLLNLALSALNGDVPGVLGDAAVQHYSAALQKALA